VGEQVEHGAIAASGASVARCRCPGQEHVAELADRRVGEHALEVVLGQGDQPGEQGGDAADNGDDELRSGASTNNGVQRATM